MSEGLAIIGCGSRDWTDQIAVDEIMLQLPVGSTIIHGDCYGADLAIDAAARRGDFDIVSMPAKWDRHGLAAGPIRNSAMLAVLLDLRRLGYETRIIAFHDDPRLGTGTRDMVQKSHLKRIPIVIVSHS